MDMPVFRHRLNFLPVQAKLFSRQSVVQWGHKNVYFKERRE